MVYSQSLVAKSGEFDKVYIINTRCWIRAKSELQKGGKGEFEILTRGSSDFI
jgi:hypothetical protein